MAQKKIDQTTVQPDGDIGDDAFTAFAICNDNADDAETRLHALETGAGGVGQDVAALQLGLQQESLARQQGDVAEAQARQQAAAALDVRIDALSGRMLGDNVLINGDFDLWQRGDQFTGNSIYTADRWFIQQGNVIGQVARKHIPLPGEANFPDSRFTLGIDITGNSSATSAYQVFEQRVEDCRTFAGKVSTVSFRVFNAGAAGRKIAIELGQSFGTGGAPANLGIASQVFTLKAGMNYITKTVTLPAVTGKSIGPGHCAVLLVWSTAGSDFAARSGGLGLQTGSLHFSQMKWEAGSAATPYQRRHLAIETILCQRYYELIGFIANSEGAYYTTFAYKVDKRVPPSLTVLGTPIAPATLNNRSSERWFSMDGRVGSAFSTYCSADAEI